MPYIGNSPGTGTRNRYIYTATASQTTFSGADDNNKTLAYSDGDYVDVFLNGICLVPVDDYTATSKTSIVLTVGAAVDDILEVVAYDIATIADTVSKANGGTFDAEITVDGNLITGQLAGDPITNFATNLDFLQIGPSTFIQTGTDAQAFIKTNNYWNGSSTSYVDAARGSTNIRLNENNDGIMTFETAEAGSSLSERMRIDSDGKVGIGTNDPSTPRRMEVVGSDSSTYSQSGSINDNVVARFRNGSDSSSAQRFGGISLESGSAQWSIDCVQMASYTGALAFKTRTGSSTYLEAIRIDQGRNIVSQDVVANSGNTNGYKIRQSPSSAVTSALFESITSAGAGRYHFAFRSSAGSGSSSGSIVGSIYTTGSATSYNTSSDYRLKENVTDVTDGVTRVKQLAPKRFNFIADPDTTVDGFLAHEAQAVVPEAVHGTHNETQAIGDITDGDGNTVETGVVEPDTLEEGHTWTSTGTQPVYQGIDQSKLVPLLTAALQEAIAKIETLETEMTSVKSRLDALEAN